MTSYRLLVVSGDFRTLRAVSDVLVKEGYDVVSAGSLGEAAQMNDSLQSELVILDYPLTEKEGRRNCLNLRPSGEDVPLLILTPRECKVDKLPGFRLGIDEYQAKPFGSAELILRVRAVLSRLSVLRSLASHQTKEMIIYPDLEIKALGRVVRVNMREVELTNKEFDLLWALASKPNQVMSRLQLLSRVWNSTFPGNENTVTVHIHRLREKMENDPGNPMYIKTACGIGYKFEVTQ